MKFAVSKGRNINIHAYLCGVLSTCGNFTFLNQYFFYSHVENHYFYCLAADLTQEKLQRKSLRHAAVCFKSQSLICLVYFRPGHKQFSVPALCKKLILRASSLQTQRRGAVIFH